MKIPEIVLTPVDNDYRITIYSISMIGLLAILSTIIFMFVQEETLKLALMTTIGLLTMYYALKVFMEYFSVNRDFIIVKDKGLTIQRIPTLSLSPLPERHVDIPYKVMRKLEVISLWNPLFPGLTKKALALTIQTDKGLQKIVFGDRLPDEDLDKLNEVLLMMTGLGEKIKQVKNKIKGFLDTLMKDEVNDISKEGEEGEEVF